ncbi:hypothetical protein Goarm_006397 [Gossypium armourianum]|uniref:Uncharacterized protein n=1 Tax=Gossypium armourianum TaxID=34283 RepID=A0A7J9JHW3_9ROSI|nr:hypothetical protein [Gossypium armourianum]
MTKPSSYSTITMVIYLIYSMSRWISTCSELWHNIGIRPIAVLLSRATNVLTFLKRLMSIIGMSEQ